MEDLLQIEFTVGPVKISTSRLLELYQHLLIAFTPDTTSGSLRLTGYDPDHLDPSPSSPNLPTKRSIVDQLTPHNTSNNHLIPHNTSSNHLMPRDTSHLMPTNSKGVRAPLPLPKPARKRIDAKPAKECIDPAVSEPCYSVVNRERVRSMHRLKYWSLIG